MNAVGVNAVGVNAVGMAIPAQRSNAGGIVYPDHRVQFTSWVFTHKIPSVALLPFFGTVDNGLNNAMMESFWTTMQIELPDRQKWKARIELANAIIEYIEVFSNRAADTPHSSTPLA